MDKNRTANAILSMTNEAVDSGNKNLLYEALGFVEGMRRAGNFTDEFADLLKKYIREEWNEKRRDCRKWFGKIWGLTA